MSLCRSSDRLAAAPWARVLKVACALLVVLLGAAAHNPTLHDSLHHWAHETGCDDAQHDDAGSSAQADNTDAHECAITLFAQGLLQAIAKPAVALPVALPEIRPASASDRLPPDATSHLLPWSQAPPASR